MSNDLFDTGHEKGALFSECREYRYALWRIWDDSKPKVMFIGLNPSKADESDNDNTITRVVGFAKSWGYGGVYMLNCFPLISTDPDKLKVYDKTCYQQFCWQQNNRYIDEYAALSEEIIFAWGKFRIVRDEFRDLELRKRFPNAKCLIKNVDGSPRHPLYVKSDVKPIKFKDE